jgi:hypothetical protein
MSGCGVGLYGRPLVGMQNPPSGNGMTGDYKDLPHPRFYGYVSPIILFIFIIYDDSRLHVKVSEQLGLTHYPASAAGERQVENRSKMPLYPRPRLPAVRGLIQRLRRVNCPALCLRDKVDHSDIRVQPDGVLRPVLAAVAGAIHRAIDVLITLDSKGIAGEPAVSRISKIGRPSTSPRRNRCCGAPACSSIVGNVYIERLVLRAVEDERQDPIDCIEEDGRQGRDLQSVRRQGDGLMLLGRAPVVCDVEPGKMFGGGGTGKPTGGLVHKAEP